MEGINLVILFKRRINNAVMTIYLPTILILCIVYATNFFKDFFFEAVVTVNLTALLVLTTLFISVSQSLPPTAYLKMIDIWLIFAQVRKLSIDKQWLQTLITIFFLIQTTNTHGIHYLNICSFYERHP